MNIREFSKELLKIYNEMSLTFSAAQTQNNLNCPSDCGKCCQNPAIDASVLEMIPFALYLHDQNLVDEYLSKIDESMQGDQLCVGIKQNRCGFYNERPSLCRMFGVSGHQDKYKKTVASICKTLKEINPQDSLKIINSPENYNLPLMTHWSSKLLTLNPDLLSSRMHINLALKIAIEKAELHLSYESHQNVR